MIEQPAAFVLPTYVAGFVPRLRCETVCCTWALGGKKLLILGIALAFGVACALALLLVGCGGGSNAMILPPPPTPAFQPLTQSEVTQIVTAAALAASADTMVIAVVDRQGKVLGLFQKPNAANMVPGNFSIMEDANDVAISLARTGAFFSNNQAPLTSRTVRFISGIHLPPVDESASRRSLRREYQSRLRSRGTRKSRFKPATASAGETSRNHYRQKDLNDSDPTPLIRNPGYRGNVWYAASGNRSFA
jgi:hypothetical protein